MLAVGLAPALLVVSRLFWKVGLRDYSGAAAQGSQSGPRLWLIDTRLGSQAIPTVTALRPSPAVDIASPEGPARRVSFSELFGSPRGL
jgi:hypothetical protein